MRFNAWVGRGMRPTRLRRESGHEPMTVKALAMALAPQTWRTITWREDTNNELSGRFTALRVRPAHRDYLKTGMRPEEWLLIEWPEAEDEPRKYFLTSAPGDATLAQMVFVTKMRWRIERDYQDLKQDFGLGHYVGRDWCGFHHHATLSIAAYGFLMAQRLKSGSDASSKKTWFSGKYLPFPKITSLGEARRAQRHVPDSIACAATGLVRGTRKKPRTLSALQLVKPEIYFSRHSKTRNRPCAPGPGQPSGFIHSATWREL